MEDEAIRLTSYVRENLWDESTGFLYDQYADGSLAGVKTISAYWALLTDGLLNPAQQRQLVAHLKDTTEFCRPGMVPSSPFSKLTGEYSCRRQLPLWLHSTPTTISSFLLPCK